MMFIEDPRKDPTAVIGRGKNERRDYRIIFKAVSLIGLGRGKLAVNTSASRRLKRKRLGPRNDIPTDGDLGDRWIVVIVNKTHRLSLGFQVFISGRMFCKPIPLHRAVQILN